MKVERIKKRGEKDLSACKKKALPAVVFVEKIICWLSELCHPREFHRRGFNRLHFDIARYNSRVLARAKESAPIIGLRREFVFNQNDFSRPILRLVRVFFLDWL